MMMETNIKRGPPGQHRFRLRPYGVEWLVYDFKTKRIVEFCEDKGLARQLAGVLNSQLDSSLGWRALEKAVKL